MRFLLLCFFILVISSTIVYAELFGFGNENLPNIQPPEVTTIVTSNASFNQTLADNTYLKLSGNNANQNININNYNITAGNLCYSNGTNCQSQAGGVTATNGANTRVAFFTNSTNINATHLFTFNTTNNKFVVNGVNISGGNATFGSNIKIYEGGASGSQSVMDDGVCSEVGGLRSCFATEVSGELVSLGINTQQFGNVDTTRSGFIFRGDVRGVINRWYLARRAPNTAIEDERIDFYHTLDTGNTLLGGYQDLTSEPIARLELRTYDNRSALALVTAQDGTPPADDIFFILNGTQQRNLFVNSSEILHSLLGAKIPRRLILYDDYQGFSCTGTATACDIGNFATAGSCDAQAGCFASYGGDCSAFSNTDQATCETGHEGCTWNDPDCTGNYYDVCDGTALTCGECSAEQCATQSGCSVSYTYNETENTVYLGNASGVRWGESTIAKQAWYNNTPIVQPSGNSELIRSIKNLGLIGSGNTTINATQYWAGNLRGINKNITIAKNSTTLCNLNFTEGLLTSTTC